MQTRLKTLVYSALDYELTITFVTNSCFKKKDRCPRGVGLCVCSFKFPAEISLCFGPTIKGQFASSLSPPCKGGSGFV